MDLQKLFTLQNIKDACKHLSKKGVKKDFSDLRRFSLKEENNLSLFLKDLSLEKYYSGLKKFSFDSYTGIKINKSNKKYRPLLIPKSKDRVVLAAALPKVKNILEEKLKANKALGLGLNKRKETFEFKQTLSEIQELIKEKSFNYILILDFKNFFSTIDRKILFKELSKNFKGLEQRRLFRFIKKSIENDIQADADFHGSFGFLKLKVTGIPQGLSYSPLLASFYTLPLDKVDTVAKECRGYRYLDDMIILSKSKKQAEKAYEYIKEQSEKLKLQLHPLGPTNSKTKLIDIRKKNFEFLGIEISKEKLLVPQNAKNKFKETLRGEIVNSKTVKEFKFNQIKKVYKDYARGWVNHYKTLCPKSFKNTEIELLEYLDRYIEKRKSIKTVGKFFGPKRLTLSPPFIRMKNT